MQICAISCNTGVGAGTPISSRFYIHETINDHNLLFTDSADLAGPWCALARCNGTSAGFDGASVLTLDSDGSVAGNQALDLAPGQYLVAWVADNFNNRYTTGDGGNQSVSDANLTFDSGKASNAPFRGFVFSPRVFNGTFVIVIAQEYRFESLCC